MLDKMTSRKCAIDIFTIIFKSTESTACLYIEIDAAIFKFFLLNKYFELIQFNYFFRTNECESMTVKKKQVEVVVI